MNKQDANIIPDGLVAQIMQFELGFYLNLIQNNQNSTGFSYSELPPKWAGCGLPPRCGLRVDHLVLSLALVV